MRFVAGLGAVAEQLPVGAVAELLTGRGTSADWQGRGREPSGSIWQGRRGGAVAGQGAVAELLLAVKSYSTIGKRILAKMQARRSSCGMPVEFN